MAAEDRQRGATKGIDGDKGDEEGEARDRREIDRRGRLETAPFTFRTTKDGKVFLSWQGRQVTILRGAAAQKFLAAIAAADEPQAQLMMARATGHFKHGNER